MRIRGRRSEPPRDQRDDFDPDEDEPELTPTPLWKRKGVLLLVGAGVVVILFIFTRGPSPVIQTATQDQAIGVTQPYEAPIVKVAAPASIVPPAPPPQPPSQPLPDFTKSTPKPAAASPPATGPHMVYYPIQIDQRTTEKQDKEPAEPAKTKLKFAAKDLPGTKASPQIDSTYMLMPGLLLCVLDVAIDSNLPGPLQCHLPGPAYSRKGVVLMEDQTQVFGSYESMKQNGIERLEATSIFAVTPNDIWVPLAGDPFADQLGRTGMGGTIDKRLLERFGGAVLLDLSQNALQIAQSSVSKGGSTYLSFNGADQLASQILQSTINLPPIFTKNQGSMIAIWIKEPISFNDSYRITKR